MVKHYSKWYASYPNYARLDVEVSIMNTQALRPEIEAFEKMKDDLIAHHYGKFVIIKNQQLKGSFDTFDTAAREAIKLFGKGPYLIRRVSNEKPMTMPASVAYRAVHATY
jgi:hypothetical protein